MTVNTIQELINLLNQVDTDANVLAAISNDSAVSTVNGPGPGLVTTRLGANVKNVQKVIADIESGILVGARPKVQDQGVDVVLSPNALNFLGGNVVVTDGGGGVANITIDFTELSKTGTPLANQVAVWGGDGPIGGSNALLFDGSTFIVRSDTQPTFNLTDINDLVTMIMAIVNPGTPVSIFGNTTAHDLRIQTSNIPRITITADGLIGVGTNNPSQLLTLNAETPTIRMQDASSLNVSEISNSDTVLRFAVDTANTEAASAIVFEMDAAEVARFSDGNLIMFGDNYVRTASAVNPQTGVSYTLAIADTNGIVTMNNAGANTVSIDPVASTAYPIGYTVEVIQLGAGATTIDAGVGVTLNGVAAGNGTITAQYDVVRLRHVASDVWIVSGDIGVIA